MADISKAQEGRKSKILDRLIRDSGGKVMTRREWIAAKLAEGYEPRILEERDHKAEEEERERLRRWSLNAPTGNENHPETKALRAAQAKLAKGIYRVRYVLTGKYLGVECNKTEFDYAIFLQQEAEAARPAPVGEEWTVEIIPTYIPADYGALTPKQAAALALDTINDHRSDLSAALVVTCKRTGDRTVVNSDGTTAILAGKSPLAVLKMLVEAIRMDSGPDVDTALIEARATLADAGIIPTNDPNA